MRIREEVKLKVQKFKEYVKPVEKLSKRGYTFHKRTLYVDDVEIKYYSQHFAEDVDLSKKAPKEGVPVHLVEILEPDQNWQKKYKKKNSIRIGFPVGCQMHYKQSDLQYLRLSTTNKIIESMPDHVAKFQNVQHQKFHEWVFSFTTPFEKHKLIDLIKGIKSGDTSNQNQQVKQKDGFEQRREKYQQSFGQDVYTNKEDYEEDEAQMDNRDEFSYEIDDNDYDGIEGLGSNEKRRQKDGNQGQDTSETYKFTSKLIEKREIDKQQRSLDNKEEQDKKNKKREQTSKKMDEKVKEQNYKQVYHQHLISYKKQTKVDTTIENGIKIFQLMVDFKAKATEHAVNVVDSYILPGFYKQDITYKPHIPKDQKKVNPNEISSNQSSTNATFPDEILVTDKVGHYKVTMASPNDPPKVIRENQMQAMVLYESNKGKLLNLKFLGMETILNTILELSQILDQKNLLIVPLSCLITYKGFKVLVQTNNHFSEKDLVFGYGNNKALNQFQTCKKDIEQDLQFIGKKLRLRPHPYDTRAAGSTGNEVYLSYNINIYSAGRQSSNPGDLQLGGEFSQTEYEENNNKYTNLYYLEGCEHIFPLDADQENAQKIKYFQRQRMRPELMTNYQEVSKNFNPDAFQQDKASKNNEFDEYELTQIAANFRKTWIPFLINRLDQMNVMPMDSYTLKIAFHEAGVNMRFLGEVANKSQLPHIQEMCIVEMIARSSKKILFADMARLQYQMSIEPMTEQLRKLIDQNPNDAGIYKEQLLLQNNEALKNVVAGHLNLIFGNTELSKEYFESILKQQIQFDFRYDIFGYDQIKELPVGGLLSAIQYAFAIKIKERQEFLQMTEPNPFVPEDILNFLPQSRTFNMSKHKLLAMFSFYEKHRENKNFEMALKLLSIKHSIETSFEDHIAASSTLAEIADIYIQTEQYEQAISTCRDGLMALNSYEPTTIKFISLLMRCFIKTREKSKVMDAFNSAKKVIRFNFGPYHPLHSNFHSYLAYFYLLEEDYEESLKQYQIAMNDCLRILGIDHPYTGQMYLDVANVYLKVGKREDAIKYLEKAFEIFDASKNSESPEKASLANQIAALLYDFGSLKDSIQFANRSYNIYNNIKNKDKYIEKILDNKLVICKASSKLKHNATCLEECEKTYYLLTSQLYWRIDLGHYLIELLKLTFIIMTQKMDHQSKCNIYYIIDMIHKSFNKLGNEAEVSYLNQLKRVINDNKNCTQFLDKIFTTIFSERYGEYFQVNNLVNKTYAQFLGDGQNIDEVCTQIMENLKVMYYCVGPEFLMKQIKPLY